MKKTLAFLFYTLFCTALFFGQEVVFEVQVTADTLYMGNTLGVKYTIKNAQGDFEPPEFEGFELAGGPNVSTQFTMVNGETTQSASYEYFLVPYETGVHSIPPAILKQGDEDLSSNAVQVIVVDNPEGIQQSLRKYRSGSELILPMEKKKMTKKDSLLLKLRKIKGRKI